MVDIQSKNNKKSLDMFQCCTHIAQGSCGIFILGVHSNYTELWLTRAGVSLVPL